MPSFFTLDGFFLNLLIGVVSVAVGALFEFAARKKYFNLIYWSAAVLAMMYVNLLAILLWR